MDPPFGNSFLPSSSSAPLPGMNGSATNGLFGSGSSLLNVDYDCSTLRQLQEEKMKNAALQRQYEEEKNLRKELERELAEMKKYMFADMSSMWAVGSAPGAGDCPSSSMLSPSVSAFSPTVAPGTSRLTPTKNNVKKTRSDSEIRSLIISESIDMLGDKDPLFGDSDMMRDIDVLSAQLFVSPEKTGLKRDTSRHSFGKDDAGNSAPDLSGLDKSDDQLTNGKPSVSSNAIENARKRAEVIPLNIAELEQWLKCKADFSTKWMQQKSDFMEKWNFCHEQFTCRWMKEVTARFSTEDMYEYPIKCFIYHILSTRGPQPCGEIGKILKEITQKNEIHLMQMIKVNYKGLKKFIELFSDLFHIGTEHPFNPTVYLVNRKGLPPPFPAHLVNNLEYANEILELGLKVNKVENEHIERPPPSDESTSGPSFSSSGSPYYDGNSAAYYHRNQSMSTDSAVSSRSNSAASHTSHETTGRGGAHEMRGDHMFYDPGSDTWSGLGQTSHYVANTGGGYDKNSPYGNKPYHPRSMKRPSHSNIFSVAVDSTSPLAKEVPVRRKK